MRNRFTVSCSRVSVVGQEQKKGRTREKVGLFLGLFSLVPWNRLDSQWQLMLFVSLCVVKSPLQPLFRVLLLHEGPYNGGKKRLCIVH